ncbi:MAG: AlwI family type II restriction endonuclease [Fusobacterium periodonticum]|jgi:CCATC--recognizing type II restriction modification system (mmyCVI) endonuclease subunit|nr:AlwI family type II restriction endonuclease [Fusobacterium periodonticum]
MGKRKDERKPLSFSTTMRNPERISQFVDCIKDFEGQILTEELIMKIVKKVIKNKLYKPTYIVEVEGLKNIYDQENSFFSESELDNIMTNSSQQHKEAGFQKGWPSRFDTWYKLCKEFGFVYYEMNKKIEVSSSGHMLCEAYLESPNETEDNNLDDSSSGEKIQKIFLNALVKYQTNNPFRRNANINAPVPLLLNVLKLLNKKAENAGIYRKELPFLICWNNSNHVELYDFIIKFREKYKFKASDEVVYEECLKLLDSDNRNRFKMNQIIKESVDDLIRKLRITGIFSLRGMGRFIDINKLEEKTVDYILKKYTNFITFDNEYEFYKYMSDLDPYILANKEVNNENLNDIRVQALRRFSTKYSLDEIIKELKKLQSSNKPSEDEYLKLIDSPTRLEFLTSLLLVKKYPHYIVKANYSVDDEGNPTFTARGGVADIEVYDTNMDSLVEVTLMKNRQQATNEIPAITRHLKEQREKSNKEEVFSIFIAPSLHPDTIYMCEFTMYKEKLGIYSYVISDFVEKLNSTNSLLEMKY